MTQSFVNISLEILIGGIIGWVVFTEWRLRDFEAKLLMSEERNIDAEIVAKAPLLSELELDSLLAKDLGDGPETKK